jgi:4-amino-4-deoxy-L-arabinose transferase-like glycosyltransferase
MTSESTTEPTDLAPLGQSLAPPGAVTVTAPAETPDIFAGPSDPADGCAGPDQTVGSEPPSARVGWARRLMRGRDSDPSWVRPALIVLLIGTAGLYIWDLGASGWANSFYSAAVQAGSKSWRAAFFGSSDASNFITVDKPPASLWVMEVSARLFGVNAWSILVPQALEGVASVGVVYLTVRRWFSPAAGLLAGGVLALTPVAVLMFRFNNPDALLVLLLALATYATVRALESAQTRWLVLMAVLVGTGFLTKMMQAYLVMPAIGLVYLLAAPTRLRRRIWQLAVAAVALVVASGWWVLAVQLTPAADRPYVGGSQNNSILNLIFGYNGFGRLSGNEAGSVVGGVGRAAGGSLWGPTGLNRLFLSDMGGQIAWLLPAALLFLVVGLVVTIRAPRTDRTRAAYLLWGGSLVVTGLVFSFAQGIIHPYYTVALAPPIGALVGMGTVTMWARRSSLWARAVLAVALAGTAVWAWFLLDRSSTWFPWLRLVVLVAGLIAAALFLLPPGWLERWVAVVAVVAVGVILAGPAAYSLQTAGSPESGAIPSAGPAVSGGGFGGFGGGGGRFRGGGGRPGGFAGAGGPAGGAGAGTGRFTPPAGGAAGPGGGGFGGAGGAAGGLLNGSIPGAALTKALSVDASSYKWVAAITRSNAASGYQLATGDPVMAIGGFNGTDPAPTLAQFEAYVQAGDIHYYIASGGFGGFGAGSGTDDASIIQTWVTSHYTAETISGTNVYDLSKPATKG